MDRYRGTSWPRIGLFSEEKLGHRGESLATREMNDGGQRMQVEAKRWIAQLGHSIIPSSGEFSVPHVPSSGGGDPGPSPVSGRVNCARRPLLPLPPRPSGRKKSNFVPQVEADSARFVGWAIIWRQNRAVIVA